MSNKRLREADRVEYMRILKDVCLIGETYLACRYIHASVEGVTCAKINSKLRKAIDEKVENSKKHDRGEITIPDEGFWKHYQKARGDNCKGRRL